MCSLRYGGFPFVDQQQYSGDFNQHPHPQTRDFSKMLMAAFQSNVCAASVDHFIAVCCGADHLNSILPKAVAVTKPKQFLTWLFGMIDIRSYWYLVLLFLVLLVFGFIAIRFFFSNSVLLACGLIGIRSYWCLVLLVFGRIGIWSYWYLVVLVFGFIGIWSYWYSVLLVFGLIGIWSYW